MLGYDVITFYLFFLKKNTICEMTSITYVFHSYKIISSIGIRTPMYSLNQLGRRTQYMWPFCAHYCGSYYKLLSTIQITRGDDVSPALTWNYWKCFTRGKYYTPIQVYRAHEINIEIHLNISLYVVADNSRYLFFNASR